MSQTTTTKEHVHRLIDELDEAQLKELESQLILHLERTYGPIPWMPEHYDPLGGIVGLVGPDDYDGPTDVSSNKYKYVADAIDPE